jgi:hypothetical protein
MMQVRIYENSRIAAIAAFKLRTRRCAVVIGHSIFLHKTLKEEFLSDTRWVKHELCHVRQWKQKGWLLFGLQYLWLSIRFGYYNNPFEIEARNAETSDFLPEEIIIQ